MCFPVDGDDLEILRVDDGACGAANLIVRSPQLNEFLAKARLIGGSVIRFPRRAAK